jgi:hypothetical protein
MFGSKDGKSKKNNEWVTCWERIQGKKVTS